MDPTLQSFYKVDPIIPFANIEEAEYILQQASNKHQVLQKLLWLYPWLHC
jgi:hypothetical protein